jgi:hypothetical protein
MVEMEKLVVSLYVTKSRPAHWIVRDQHGRFWVVPPGENSWNRREPYDLTEETELEPVPGHYKYMLDLPV